MSFDGAGIRSLEHGSEVRVGETRGPAFRRGLTCYSAERVIGEAASLIALIDSREIVQHVVRIGRQIIRRIKLACYRIHLRHTGESAKPIYLALPLASHLIGHRDCSSVISSLNRLTIW